MPTLIVDVLRKSRKSYLFDQPDRPRAIRSQHTPPVENNMTTNVLRRTWVRAVLLLAAALHGAEGANILSVSAVGGKSHWNFMRGILGALTDRGHRVTVLTPYPDGDRENYTEVDVSDLVPSLVTLDLDYVEEHLTAVGDIVSFIHGYSRDACKNVYGHRAFRELIGDRGARANFDVVFTEIMASECVAHLSALLGDVPLVYVTPPPLISYMERAVLGHHPNPAVVSNTLAQHHVPTAFLDRFTNTLLHCYTTSLLRYNVWSVPWRDRQPFDVPDPVKPSIVFSNAHYITDASRPMPPNVIPVGGIHLSPPKAIPQDLLEFIENSPRGVIVFTLGSVVSISSLPMNIRKAIIDVLGQVPQRVLMKYEKGEMPDLPTNIKTVKWLPQRDILMHPNVKLFISHGGISGIYEAVDAGIPVLGFPVFFDQPRNIEGLVNAGMAISLNLKSISKDTFLNAVIDLINNDKYRRNAKIAAERFKDRPMSPAQTVDYWTRYIIRHKGAPHLKSHALNLTWYQYFLLDVLGVLFLMSLFILFVMYKCVQLAKKLILGSTKSKSE